VNEYLEDFVKIRETLTEKLESMLEVYLCGIWDPLMSHTIIKELKQIITRDIANEYPDFPTTYIPKVKVKIYKESEQLETSTQIYLNTDRSLTFLSSIELGGSFYDLYCRESWDPSVSHVFYARYGHDYNSFLKGAHSAAKEYFIGAMTPLSIAFGIAVEDGFIP
jgi:hypothetical protein